MKRRRTMKNYNALVGSFRFIIMLFLGSFCALSSHDIAYPPHEWYTHYENRILNAGSIAYFSQSPDFTLQDSEVLSWIAKHRDILLSLANQIVYDDLTDYAQSIESGNELLTNIGCTNSSMHNFVFALDAPAQNKKYWVKIAGPNRFEQLNALLGRPWGTPVTQLDHLGLGKNRTKTYQSASRMGRYLLYQKWKELHPNSYLKVPRTYLIPLSEQQIIDDAHCIIIEEHSDARKELNNNADIFVQEQNALQDFIVQLGLWNINPSQFLVQDDGHLVCVDLEDPDNSNPDHFFNADYEKIKHNISCGLAELQHMMHGDNLD